MDDGKLSVAISEQRREFIEEELAAGRYADESEVVDAALSLLENRKKLEDLCALVAEGDMDVTAGRLHRYDSSEAFLADIKSEDSGH